MVLCFQKFILIIHSFTLYSNRKNIGMVFCFENCYDLLWEKIVLVMEKKSFEIQGWCLRICENFDITTAIYSNSEMSEQFLKQNAFLTCSLMFLRSNTLEQFKFKLEKITGIQKHAGKVKKKKIRSL